jgi:hypothetical protein
LRKKELIAGLYQIKFALFPSQMTMTDLPSTKRMFVAFAVMSLSALAVTGCSQFDLRNSIPWSVGSDGKFESPMQLVPFWSAAVQNIGDGGGLRGFGGRLYFYGRNPNKPIKVKGTLVIYAFDEKGRDPKNVVPDRKYIFNAEQFKSKFSKTELGPSYSIWLPWDEVGGAEKRISLIVRFTSETGEMVSSEQAAVRLPGALPDSSMNAATAPGAAAPQTPAMPSTTPSLSALATKFAVQPAVSPAPEIDAHGNLAASGVVQASATSPLTTMPGMVESTGGQSPDGFGPVEIKRMTTTTIPVSSTPQGRMPQASAAQSFPAITVAPPAAGATEVPLSPLRAQMVAAGAVPSVGLAGYRQRFQGGPQKINSPRGSIANSQAQTAQASANQDLQSSTQTSAQGVSMGPEARSEPVTPRVLGGPIARPEIARVPTQQFLAGSQSGLPSAP